jgi:hypothetical protein
MLLLGRVIASDVTADDGTYHLEGLAPGQYRVVVASAADNAQKFRSFELSSQVAVKPDVATPLNSNLIPPQVSGLNPKVIGLNAELSSVALPLTPGKRVEDLSRWRRCRSGAGHEYRRQFAVLYG